MKNEKNVEQFSMTLIVLFKIVFQIKKNNTLYCPPNYHATLVTKSCILKIYSDF